MAELEGFLCPLCKQDCRSVRELEEHYRERHDETTTSSKLKNNFMSFIDKAKTTLKIEKSPKPVRSDFSRSASSEDSVPNQREHSRRMVNNVSGFDAEYWDPQEMGPVKEYTIEFRRIRDARLAERVVKTNRLIIRLEKFFRLLKENTPKTAKQMRSVEQNVVPWKKDDETKNCGSCGHSFGVRRRRHHCRLCGGIMCKQCSNFMTLGETYPLLHNCPDYHNLAVSPSLLRRKFPPLKTKRRDTKSQEESEEETADNVRMCPECKMLIDRQLMHMEAMEKPVIMDLYEKMQSTMSESEHLKPSFLEVASVIWSGEHGPSLESASVQRQELLRVYESIDSISKQILSMGMSDPSPKGQKLSRSVRVFASNYLQEHLLTLPSLPTLEQLREVKKRKEREAEERLREIEHQREEQRRLNAICEAETAAEEMSGLEKLSAGMDKFSAGMDRLLSMDKIKDLTKDFQSKISFKKDGESVRVSGGSEESGWMCDTDMVVRSVDSEEDPFMVQREQLLSYITQARDANRMDEVHALEVSLRDIEAAMEEQQMSYGFSKQFK